jgi:hypothetical protein
MKTLITLFATTVLSLSAYTSTAQTVFLNEEDVFMGRPTTIQGFAVVDIDMEPVNNGFIASWGVYNQDNVDCYELQVSENNKDFTTIKKINRQAATNSQYKIDVSNTVVFAKKTYCRIKIVSTGGQAIYTESKKLTIISK